jgi:hypothetical protein
VCVCACAHESVFGDGSWGVGPLDNHGFKLPQPGFDTMLIERKQTRDIVKTRVSTTQQSRVYSLKAINLGDVILIHIIYTI